MVSSFWIVWLLYFLSGLLWFLLKQLFPFQLSSCLFGVETYVFAAVCFRFAGTLLLGSPFLLVIRALACQRGLGIDLFFWLRSS